MDSIVLQKVVPQVLAGQAMTASDVWLHDFTFERGKRYLVVSASGTGKSSLCSYIYGYRADYQGTISFDSRDIRSLTPADWQRVRRKSVSLMFQELRMFPELTAWENVRLKNNLTGYKSREEVEALFQVLGMSDKLHEPVGRLSFGQQQRVAFVRCLCQPFDFLLLDEPVSHLDDANALMMAQVLDEELQRQEAGLIVTSVGKHLPMTYDFYPTL